MSVEFYTVIISISIAYSTKSHIARHHHWSMLWLYPKKTRHHTQIHGAQVPKQRKKKRKKKNSWNIQRCNSSHTDVHKNKGRQLDIWENRFYRFTKPYNKRLKLKIFFCSFVDCFICVVFVCLYFYCVFAISIFCSFFPFLFSRIFLTLSYFFLRAFTGYNNQNVVPRFSVVETLFCRIDLLQFKVYFC